MHLYKRQKTLIIDGTSTLVLQRDRRKGSAAIKLSKSINKGNESILLKNFHLIGIGKGTFKEKINALLTITKFIFWHPI